MTDTTEKASETKVAEVVSPVGKKPMPREIGGVPGLEPMRYGDWEHKGRCTDF